MVLWYDAERSALKGTQQGWCGGNEGGGKGEEERSDPKPWERSDSYLVIRDELRLQI